MWSISRCMMVEWKCTFLFSSLNTVIALLCRILCSLSLDRARRSTSHKYSASFTLPTSCSFRATRFSSICLFNWSSSSLLSEEDRLITKVYLSMRCDAGHVLKDKKTHQQSLWSEGIHTPVFFSFTAASIKGFSPPLMIPDTSMTRL